MNATRTYGLFARTTSALVLLASLALVGCESETKSERAVSALHEGGDVERIRALVKENFEKHVEAVQKVANRLTPLFQSETPPSEEQLRSALAATTKPPEVIQALVFSPVDLMVVLDTDGAVLARDRDTDGNRFFEGRNLFEESPELRAAFERGKPTHVVGKLGRGDKAVPYIYFVAPIQRDGEAVAAAVIGYGLWKEGNRITLQMRREAEQGKERVLVIWAFAYLGDEFYKLPNSPLEVEDVIPDAATRRADLAKNPNGYVTNARILKRDVAIAVIPFPEIAEDFGIIYLR